MKLRTLLAATFVSAALASSASAFSLSSFEYNFTLSDDSAEIESTVIEGFLDFGDLYESDLDDWQKPDRVAVIANSAMPDDGDPLEYGIGDYNTAKAQGQGFFIETNGNISDSDYRILGSNGILEFKLEFGSKRGQLSRHVASCEYFNDAIDCYDNIFAPREAQELELKAEFVRIDTDEGGIPAVPLPAGLPLMLVGLAGLAGFRARRKTV